MNLNSIPVIGFHKSHESLATLLCHFKRVRIYIYTNNIRIKKEQSSALIIPWIHSTTKPIFLMYSKNYLRNKILSKKD